MMTCSYTLYIRGTANTSSQPLRNVILSEAKDLVSAVSFL